MPAIEPMDSPNSTNPISAVDAPSLSRIAGVRVTQDAIETPGKKKKMNRARLRCFSERLGKGTVLKA